MVLPSNGMIREWPLERNIDLVNKYLPLTGQYIFYGWNNPVAEAWHVNTKKCICLGDFDVIEARFNKYMVKGAEILLHQRSVNGYFIFNL